MEKIRKALDRAREERAAFVVGGDTAARRPSPGMSSAASAADDGGYSYTNTRSFKPDPAHLESQRVLASGERSPAGEAYRMLRTQTMQRLGERGWRSLAVFSPGPGDGRTLTATNLAVAIAGDPRYSVLLCELDLRSPSIASLFGLTVTAGVDDVLTGQAKLSDCLVHPEGFDRLVLAPARQAIPRSSEVLASDSARRLIAELRGRYPDRILIFDLPPLLVADDALAFSPNTECGLLVVGEGATRREDVMRCAEMLRNTPIVGSVLNRSLVAKTAAA